MATKKSSKKLASTAGRVLAKPKSATAEDILDLAASVLTQAEKRETQRNRLNANRKRAKKAPRRKAARKRK